jgi:uncharacterized membrane protein
MARFQLSILRAHLESRSHVSQMFAPFSTIMILVAVAYIGAGYALYPQLMGLTVLGAGIILVIVFTVIFALMFHREWKIQGRIRAELNLLATGEPISNDQFMRFLNEISQGSIL